jgi:hypothetical protein
MTSPGIEPATDKVGNVLLMHMFRCIEGQVMSMYASVFIVVTVNLKIPLCTHISMLRCSIILRNTCRLYIFTKVFAKSCCNEFTD